MDAKAAINVAKAELASLFAEDKISNIELEEIQRHRDQWHVTLSFLRPSRERPGELAKYLPADILRERRVVTVNKNGEVTAVTNFRPLVA